MQGRMYGPVDAQGKAIPQSASLTAPFTQGSLWESGMPYDTAKSLLSRSTGLCLCALGRVAQQAKPLPHLRGMAQFQTGGRVRKRKLIGCDSRTDGKSPDERRYAHRRAGARPIQAISPKEMP